MYNVHGLLGRNLVHVYIAECINVVNVRTRRKVREYVMFMTTKSDVSATVHQIAELCEWTGERAYRPNQANGFNEEDIDTLIEYLCTG